MLVPYRKRNFSRNTNKHLNYSSTNNDAPIWVAFAISVMLITAEMLK